MSYRKKSQQAVLTTDRSGILTLGLDIDPAMKFFLLGLSLVLVNLWARLRWLLFRRRGRGPRTVLADAFRLKRFVAMLRRAIEQLYWAVMSIPTTGSPQILNY